MRPHFFSSKRTIQSYSQRPGVGNRNPECLDGLTGQGSPTIIRDGSTDDKRDVLFRFFVQVKNGMDGCFGIEGVKNGFQQEQIDTALQQTDSLFIIMS